MARGQEFEALPRVSHLLCMTSHCQAQTANPPPCRLAVSRELPQVLRLPDFEFSFFGLLLVAITFYAALALGDPLHQNSGFGNGGGSGLALLSITLLAVPYAGFLWWLTAAMVHGLPTRQDGQQKQQPEERPPQPSFSDMLPGGDQKNDFITVAPTSSRCPDVTLDPLGATASFPLVKPTLANLPTSCSTVISPRQSTLVPGRLSGLVGGWASTWRASERASLYLLPPEPAPALAPIPQGGCPQPISAARLPLSTLQFPNQPDRASLVLAVGQGSAPGVQGSTLSPSASGRRCSNRLGTAALDSHFVASTDLSPQRSVETDGMVISRALASLMASHPGAKHETPWGNGDKADGGLESNGDEDDEDLAGPHWQEFYGPYRPPPPPLQQTFAAANSSGLKV